MTETVKQSNALVKKWAPKFGFGEYRFVVSLLPVDKRPPEGSHSELVWAESVYYHTERFAKIRVVPDGMLPEDVLEYLILHELAHGLFQLSAEEGLPLESACNRMSTLLLGPNSVGPNEWAEARWPEYQWSSPSVPGLIPEYVQLLPERERHVIIALFWDNRSLREVGRELGVSHMTIRRIRDKALERLSKGAACRVES